MKRVFVTGVTRGLGQAVFQQLIARGYFVYGLLRDKKAFVELSADLPKNGRLVLGDISLDSVMDSIQETVEGPIHLLVNNAGIGGRGVTLEKVRPAEVNDVFNVHCTGILRVVRALQPHLLSAPDAVVVNVSSRMGSIANQNAGTYKDLRVSYSYRIAKAAQNMLTCCLRNEFEDKIRFIGLHPGKMKTRSGQVDADLEPGEAARRLIHAWESGNLPQSDGILELGAPLIPW